MGTPEIADRFHLRGVVLPEEDERDIYVRDGLIHAEPAGDEVTLMRRGFILPGLVDMHAHLATNSPAGNDAPAEERVRASARAHLDVGVLLIREPGSRSPASRGIRPEEGLPRVITSGRFVAARGGFIPGAAVEVPQVELVDAVLAQVPNGDGWVKIIGDYASNGQLSRNFTIDALGEAVARAHRAGARVAIHANLPETIEDAIEAGVDTIEHGTFLNREHIAAMAARGIALVPTLVAMQDLQHLVAALLEPDERDRLAEAAQRLPRRVADAAEAGVRIFAGTDAGIVAHGLIRDEIRLLSEAGVPREKAVAAASWDAREFLGLRGVRNGEGAEFLVFPSDPRTSEVDPVLRVFAGALVGATSETA